MDSPRSTDTIDCTPGNRFSNARGGHDDIPFTTPFRHNGVTLSHETLSAVTDCTPTHALLTIGDDHINGITLYRTICEDGTSRTTVLGIHLGREDLLRLLEETIRDGSQEEIDLDRLSFPGHPGRMIGISMGRERDYTGLLKQIDWDPESASGNFDPDKVHDRPLVEERWHQAEPAGSSVRRAGLSAHVNFKQSDMSQMFRTAQNLHSGEHHFKERSITGARVWLALDSEAALTILRQQYPRWPGVN